MSFEETMVLLVFGFAAFMWVTRTFYGMTKYRVLTIQ